MLKYGMVYVAVGDVSHGMSMIGHGHVHPCFPFNNRSLNFNFIIYIFMMWLVKEKKKTSSQQDRYLHNGLAATHIDDMDSKKTILSVQIPFP